MRRFLRKIKESMQGWLLKVKVNESCDAAKSAHELDQDLEGMFIPAMVIGQNEDGSFNILVDRAFLTTATGAIQHHNFEVVSVEKIAA